MPSSATAKLFVLTAMLSMCCYGWNAACVSSVFSRSSHWLTYFAVIHEPDLTNQVGDYLSNANPITPVVDQKELRSTRTGKASPDGLDGSNRSTCTLPLESSAIKSYYPRSLFLQKCPTLHSYQTTATITTASVCNRSPRGQLSSRKSWLAKLREKLAVSSTVQ